MIYYDYEFKTEKYRKKYQYELDNIDINIKNISIQQVVSNFRKLFKITPARLRVFEMDNYYKQFAIYVCLNYTNVSNADIVEYFNISFNDITQILQNCKLKTKYQKDIDRLFEPYKNDYLANIRACLAAREDIWDDVLLKLENDKETKNEL